MKTSFLLLYGFGWSGSGAVLDLLKEIDDIEVSDTYFFLIRDHGGIIDLYNALVNDWDVFRSSSAIKTFIKLCKRSKKKMLSAFSVAGRNYKKQFGKRFDDEISAFLDKITSFRYYCYEHSLNMDKNYINTQKSRLIHNLDKIGIKLPISKDDIYYFSKPTKDIFNSAVFTLLSNLYNLNNSTKKYLLIDHHPLSIHNYVFLDRFFGNDSKMIVVDRDPRDIYCDLIDNRMRIGSEMYRGGDVNKYIVWHKKTREFQNKENVLFVRFEKLVLNYENEIKRIFDFLNIEENKHVLKFKFFDPSVSKNNIGIWKKRYDNHKQEFDEIYNQLTDYCWKEDPEK